MYDFVYTSVKKNPYRDGALPPNSTLLLNHSVLPFENISQKDAQPLDRAPLVWQPGYVMVREGSMGHRKKAEKYGDSPLTQLCGCGSISTENEERDYER